MSGTRSATQEPTTFENAERALATDTSLDYERPFVTKARARDRTITMFNDLCRNGHNPSCWIAAGFDRTSPHAFRFVEARCRSGDLMSCRALPGGKEATFQDLPGAMSRNPACFDSASPDCDLAVLRAECGVGFPVACVLLSTAQIPDRQEVSARVFKLTAEGCGAGIASECIHEDDSSAHTGRMQSRLCDLTDDCWSLSQFNAAMGDHEGERNSLERMCQYDGKRGIEACIELAERYTSHTLTEPVAGRGKALLDYACPKLQMSRQRLLVNHPDCQQASGIK